MAEQVDLCRWWLRNHTNMPSDWEAVRKAYELEQNAKKEESNVKHK